MKNVQKTKNFLLPILLLVIGSIVIMTAVVTFINISNHNKYVKNDIEYHKNIFLDTEKAKVYNKVTLVNESIRYLLKNEQDKKGSKLTVKEVNELKKIAIIRFNNFNVSKNSYLFILDLHNIDGGDDFATMIVNPNRSDLIGKKLNDSYKDVKGKAFRKEILNNMRSSGAGYTKYWYKKPDTNKISKKMSYFLLNKEWNWIIASGFYFDDCKENISKMEDSVNLYSQKTFNTTITILFFVVMIAIFISYFLSFKINNTISSYIDELLKKTNELEKAQKLASMGSWSYDIISKKLFWSDEIYNIFEVDKENFTPSYDSFLGFIHPDDRGLVNEKYFNSLKTKEPYLVIHRLLMKDGRIKWVREQCDTIFNDNGIVIESDGTVEDITNEYNLQLELKTKEDIIYQQSRLTSMGEMLSNIAHQWRQPLSVITTSASGVKLQKDYGISSEENELKMLDVIVDTANHMSNTIDDFRNFFKPGVDLKYFDISDVYRKTMSLVSTKFQNNNIEIIESIESVSLYSIENELIQVIMNILSNASDILLELDSDKKYVFIDIKEIDNNLHISVKEMVEEY